MSCSKVLPRRQGRRSLHLMDLIEVLPAMKCCWKKHFVQHLLEKEAGGWQEKWGTQESEAELGAGCPASLVRGAPTPCPQTDLKGCLVIWTKQQVPVTGFMRYSLGHSIPRAQAVMSSFSGLGVIVPWAEPIPLRTGTQTHPPIGLERKVPGGGVGA